MREILQGLSSLFREKDSLLNMDNFLSHFEVDSILREVHKGLHKSEVALSGQVNLKQALRIAALDNEDDARFYPNQK